MDPANVFAKDSQADELESAQKEKPDGQGRKAGQVVADKNSLEVSDLWQSRRLEIA